MQLSKASVKRTAESSIQSPQGSPTELWLLVAWIVSLTIGLDVLSELKLYDIIGAICMVVFLPRIRATRLDGNEPVKWSGRFALIVAIETLLSVALVQSGLRLAVLALRLFRFISYLSCYVVLSRLPLDGRRLLTLLDAVLYSVLAQAVLIVLQSQGLVPILWPQAEQIYGETFPTGTLGLNHLNSVLFMTAGIAAAMARLGLGVRRRLRTLAVLVVSFPAMVTAMVLGRARSTLVAIAVLGFGALLRRSTTLAILVSAALVVLLPIASPIDPRDQLLSLWNEKVVERTGGEFFSTGSIRQIDRARPQIWSRTTSTLLDRPILLLTGTGFQSFDRLDIGAAAAHNVYLQVLAELGIVGLVVFVKWVHAIWKRLGADRKSARVWAVSSAARLCLLTILVLGVFNESFYPSRAIPGFMGFALAYLGLSANHGWAAWGSPRRPSPRTGPVGRDRQIAPSNASSRDGDGAECHAPPGIPMPTD